MMSRLKVRITAVFISFFAVCSIDAIAAASNSSNAYVNVYGSDVYSHGTPADPYATIQKGINEALISSTVYVAELTQKKVTQY